jgi:hypothetical protein
MRRSYLIEHETEADIVYRELLDLFDEVKAVYFDNPYWENLRLGTLGPSAFEV